MKPTQENLTIDDEIQSESAKHFAKLERVVKSVSATGSRQDSQNPKLNEKSGQEIAPNRSK